MDRAVLIFVIGQLVSFLLGGIAMEFNIGFLKALAEISVSAFYLMGIILFFTLILGKLVFNSFTEQFGKNLGLTSLGLLLPAVILLIFASTIQC